MAASSQVGCSPAGGLSGCRGHSCRPPVPDASRLGADWRRRLPARLDGDPALIEAMTTAYEFVSAVVAEHPHGSPGLFGPPVPVPDDAPLLDRLLGLTGRDRSWRRSNTG